MSEGRALARELARSGAANGAILKKLRDIGIEGGLAEEIAIDALVARSRVHRVRGLMTAVAGLILLVVSGLLSLFFTARVPIAVAMFGLFLCMLGAAGLFHRTKPYPERRV